MREISEKYKNGENMEHIINKIKIVITPHSIKNHPKNTNIGFYIDYDKKRKTTIIEKINGGKSWTAGKKLTDAVKRYYEKDPQYDRGVYSIPKKSIINIYIAYDTKSKSVYIYERGALILSGEKNIIKFLQIFGINPNIKHWKKDRKKQAENTIIAQTPNINTKKRLKKFLDAYFKKNDKKVSIDIDEIPTHMTPEKFYALCRGFHIENKQYYVVIDHDLKYIYKEKN